jgi:hypothetical protein
VTALLSWQLCSASNIRPSEPNCEYIDLLTAILRTAILRPAFLAVSLAEVSTAALRHFEYKGTRALLQHTMRNCDSDRRL